MFDFYSFSAHPRLARRSSVFLNGKLRKRLARALDMFAQCRIQIHNEFIPIVCVWGIHDLGAELPYMIFQSSFHLPEHSRFKGFTIDGARSIQSIL